MLFFLGMIGFLQAVFLPGALFYKMWFKGKFSFSQFIGGSFGLSIVFNYVLVSALVLFGFYTQTSLIFLVFIELVFIFMLFRKVRLSDIISYPNNNEGKEDDGQKYISRDFYLWGKILLVILIIYALMRFFEMQIFDGCDAVVSWNKWAIDWANGTFVVRSRGYSQLMPSIWSITYVMMGGGESVKLQFFALNVFHAFLFAATFMLYALYEKDKKLAIIVGFLFVMADISNRHSFFLDGSADMAVACMCFMSIVWLLLASRNDVTSEDSFRYLILSSIFAAGGAVTKQAGLFWIIGFLGTVFYYQRKGFFPSGINSKKLWILMIVIIVFVVIPWYVYSEYLVSLGKNYTETGYLIDSIHQGRTYLERIARAFKDWPNIVLLMIIASPALFNDRYRPICFFGIIYIFVWAMLFSYDRRNSSIGIPLLMFSVAGYLTSFNGSLMLGNKNKILAKFQDVILSKIKNIRLVVVLFIGLVGLCFASIIAIPAEKLFNKQNVLQTNIGNQELNRKIVELVDNEERKSLVVCQDQLIAHLSNFHGIYMPYYSGDFNYFINKAKELDVGALYFLLYGDAQNKSFADYLAKNPDIKLQKIGKYGGYDFYRVGV